MSPEEIDLKKAERTQIARSVAIDRAITLVEKGLPFEKIVALTHAIEEYLRTGKLPTVSHETGKSPDPEASPAAKAGDSDVPQVPEEKKPVAGRPGKPTRLPTKAVNELFNQAKRAGLIEGWTDYEKLIRGVLKVEGKSPYTMNAAEFATVESFLRPRLAQAKAA
jgi:hypothetical protein